MKVYTDSEVGKDLASVLNQAEREGGVRIRRGDGQAFVLTPEVPASSPLDVPGVDLDLSRDEIVAFVRQGRREIL